MSSQLDSVRDFWEEAACGENLLLPTADRAGFAAQDMERYRLEPYILDFAAFEGWGGKRVLEVGVGLGADHQRFAEAGADLVGIDLTQRGIDLTRQRLQAFGLRSDLRVGNVEALEFEAATFDLVYSWGVIHHSPDTPKAVSEIHRVLKPGGETRVMIYHKWSLIGLMLWMRFGLLRGRPLTPLAEIYARYLESPGTKAYTIAEARELFATFEDVEIRTVLTHGDLLTSGAGQRHGGFALDFARRFWPRWLFSRVASGFGLFMMIRARKAEPSA